MSVDLESTVQNVLRTSEIVKVVLSARTSQENIGTVGANSDPIGSPFAAGKERVLAVVTHVDSTTGHEEGCIFILKPKLKSSPTLPNFLSVEYVLPVVGQFSISMAQPRRNTIDLRTSSVTSTLDQPRTELTLTIKPGHDETLDPVNLVTFDISSLRSVLEECKRLKELFAASDEAAIIPTYSWTAYYTTNRPPLISSAIPQDLRHGHRPLHTLLSTASAGIVGDDAFDISLIREDWIKSRIQRLIASASSKVSLRIRIGTFNVNGKTPSQDISSWVQRRTRVVKSKLIPPLEEISPFSLGEAAQDPLEVNSVSNAARDDLSTDSEATYAASVTATTTTAARVHTSALASTNADVDEPDPDLLVLAFQELDLSTEALLYSTKTVREEAWLTASMAGLGEKADKYEKLVSKQLVGILLVIIVKKEVRKYFSDIKATHAGAGILGIMGNKGATAVRLTFTPQSSVETPSPRPAVLTFVNSHLAAFDEMFERRNADFHDLCKRLLFERDASNSEMDAHDEAVLPAAVPVNVFQSDVLFWMGDLNYRLGLSDSDVRSLLADQAVEDDLSLLLRFDQLNLARRTEKAFVNFIEHPIAHRPSYRYSSGVLTDGLGYDTKRKPAWTDRILHMRASAVHVEQSSYNSHPEITMSDHKPVSAEFDVRVPIIDTDRIESVVQASWQEVATFEHSEDPPLLKLASSTVDFGMIAYQRSVTKELKLDNMGKIPCAFRFVPVMPGTAPHPDWLFVQPMCGLIPPGRSQNISFTALVGNAVAARLNAQPSRLQDILVLHTALGKDHFISVTGEYQRTCFATSLARLVRLPGPVRMLESMDLLPEDKALTAPREVMRLVNWLMSNALGVEGLFLSAGDEVLIASIRESLDTGAEFPTFPAEDNKPIALAVASCLLQLCDSLPEPLIPPSIHARCAQVTSREDAFEILSVFPGVAVNVWISVTAFVHYLLRKDKGSPRPGNNDLQRLAALFAKIFLRDDYDSMSAAPCSPLGKRLFVSYFL